MKNEVITEQDSVSSISDDSIVISGQEAIDYKKEKKAREALVHVKDVALLFRQTCMVLKTYQVGEKSRFGKPNKNAGDMQSMWILDGQRFCDIVNRSMALDDPEQWVKRNDGNTITLQRKDGTPVVDGAYPTKRV